MFSTFNSLLNPDRGLLCIVDMESLPDDQPESLSITWKANEVEGFLRAGNLDAVVTTHPKLTMVYHAQVKPAFGGVNEAGMLQELKSQVQLKLSDSVVSRQRIEAALLSNPSRLKEWIVLTGTIARCAEEMYAFDRS